MRWNLFQLAQATARADAGRAGQGPDRAGVRGALLLGHGDLRPAVPRLHGPAVARNLLRFRYGMLRPARQRARELEPAGRAVPVADDQRRGGLGVLRRGHRAVPHQRRHRATRSRSTSRSPATSSSSRATGAEILVETARLWDDLGFFSDRHGGKFRIHGVTGPRRVHDGRQQQRLHEPDGPLEPAVRGRASVERLRDEEPEALRRACAAAELRPDEREARVGARRRGACTCRTTSGSGSTRRTTASSTARSGTSSNTPTEKFPLLLHYHPLVIYRYQVIKQADIVLAMFLLGNEFSAEQKRRELRLLRPADDGRLLAVGVHPEHRRGRDRLRRRGDRVLPLRAADGPRRRGRQRRATACTSPRRGGMWMAIVYGLRRHARLRRPAVLRRPGCRGAWNRSPSRCASAGRQLRVALTHDGERYDLDHDAPIEIGIEVSGARSRGASRSSCNRRRWASTERLKRDGWRARPPGRRFGRRPAAAGRRRSSLASGPRPACTTKTALQRASSVTRRASTEAPTGGLPRLALPCSRAQEEQRGEPAPDRSYHARAVGKSSRGRRWRRRGARSERRAASAPPRSQAVTAARRWRWSLRRLWVAAMSRHSDRQAARPRRWKRLIWRLNLSWPKTGSIVAWRWR